MRIVRKITYETDPGQSEAEAETSLRRQMQLSFEPGQFKMAVDITIEHLEGPQWSSDGEVRAKSAGLHDIFGEIERERVRQDVQWGGPDTDDKRTTNDWLTYIHKQLTMAEGWFGVARIGVSPSAWRERMVKIAALAVAAVESSYRKSDAARR